jgi:large subunit ribosomal protein L9
MKVVFMEEVEGTARVGDVKNVADGFARNYLLPRRLAAPATEHYVAIAQARAEKEARRQTRLDEEASTYLLPKMEGASVTIEVRVGEQGKLFGSVTARDIAGALQEATGVELEHRQVDLHQPIRELGSQEVTVKLTRNVEVQVMVNVEPLGGLPEAEAEAEAVEEEVAVEEEPAEEEAAAAEAEAEAEPAEEEAVVEEEPAEEEAAEAEAEAEPVEEEAAVEEEPAEEEAAEAEAEAEAVEEEAAVEEEPAEEAPAEEEPEVSEESAEEAAPEEPAAEEPEAEAEPAKAEAALEEPSGEEEPESKEAEEGEEEEA